MFDLIDNTGVHRGRRKPGQRKAPAAEGTGYLHSVFESLTIATVRYSAARVLRINKPRLLLACMPKSASSYLSSVLAGLPGLRERPVSLSTLRREQEIDPVVAARNSMRGYVSQQHIRYSPETDQLMQRFSIEPLVLVRDLPDLVVSLRDHVRNESPQMPMAWLTPAHAALPDEELDRVIADLVMPWYFTFFVGWQTCERALWLHYQDVTKNTAATVRKICDNTRLEASDGEIAAAITAANERRKRLNVGKSGRGKALSPEVMDMLYRYAGHYPDVDFNSVGLAQTAPGISRLPRKSHG